MPRRRQNLEHQVAGLAPLMRVAGGFLELGPAVLPGSAARFFRGAVPRSSSGVDRGRELRPRVDSRLADVTELPAETASLLARPRGAGGEIDGDARA